MKPKIGDYVTERNGLFLVKVTRAEEYLPCVGDTSRGKQVVVVGPEVIEDPADFLIYHQLRLQISDILETSIWPDIAAELKSRMGVE